MRFVLLNKIRRSAPILKLFSAWFKGQFRKSVLLTTAITTNTSMSSAEKGQFYRLDEDQTIWVRKNDACSDPNCVQLPLIIFVHTTSSSSSSFEHQMNSSFLGSKYRMMAIDLPGHGKSHKAAKPDVYTIEGYSRVLNSFLTVTDVKDAVVVGWGTGGTRSVLKSNLNLVEF